LTIPPCICFLGKREGAQEARFAEKVTIVNGGQSVLKESEWMSVHPQDGRSEKCLFCPEKIAARKAICSADDPEHQLSPFRREFAVKSS
jgi:hypothetical protein